ncbi:uncharacterized protein N7506_002764 [Penicillium brevicompactum]|uniref:uncharacterized protein n=1 Tax=Penicillium brevicompactum TaxID=5074 RepID=UPI00253FEC72|nr:uncharacterized protein N7506_002764 [Penicillium brevicompactum]KAJ5344399.1 hypothetical protein N7506_002764 [Penicillium brevicompactum]
MGFQTKEDLLADVTKDIEEIELAEPRGKHPADLSSIESTAPSKTAWLIAIVVSIGGLLFGYDTGYISAVLVTINDSLGHVLSSSEQEMVTSLTSGGALVGAVAAGLTADHFGRRWPIWGACLTFVIGTTLQTCAFSVGQFAAGRFIVGLGVGSASMIVPMYIGEIAPAQYRGRMVAFNNMSVTFGQLLASAVGAGLAHVKGEGWRATVGIGAAPALALAALLFFCPESPRQLVSHGNTIAADMVLRRIYPTSTAEQRQSKIRSIEASIQEATETMINESLWTTFKRIFTTPSTARATLTACTIMAISQLGGFNTLILFLVDKFGRRIILSITVLGMAICMVIAAIAFHYIPVDTATLKLTTTQGGWAGTLVLVAIICYVACFSSGVATMAWIGTELIPLEVRAIGTMLNTVTCWSTNIIISSTFLSMMKSWTPSGAFGFYSGICFFGWVFVIFFYPECKGMPLEAIRDVFKDGFGVAYSKRWQREHKDETKIQTLVLGH